MPIIDLNNPTFKGDSTIDAIPETKEEIQNYVNNMSTSEKKEYIFFLVHKVTEEKNMILEEIKKFNENIKSAVILNEISNLAMIEDQYDKVIIPLIRGVYVCQSGNPFEEMEMKMLKKRIMSKLTMAYLGEYIKSKK